MAAGPSSATLLLVEDDETTVRIVRKTLAATFPDVSVAVARNGKAGIELARKLTPDVVILDWMMPDYGGEYFLVEQSRDDRIAHLPVLVHTVIDEEQASDAISRSPAVKAFIKKLVPPVDLVEILGSFLLLRSGGSLTQE